MFSKEIYSVLCMPYFMKLCCHGYRWMEACLEDELPPTTELEQALRNGVILARLSHFFAPEVVSKRKIYDLDESKYRVSCSINVTLEHNAGLNSVL